jgi:hypothetical protein
MLLEAGGIRFLIRKLRDGDALLQREDGNECKMSTEAGLIDAIFAGEITSDELRPRIRPFQFGDDLLLKAQARGATDRAIEVWSAKMDWLKALRNAGITTIVDEPWVRTEISRLAKGELKDVQRFSISTLYQAELEIRKADGDVTAALPHYENRGGRGVSRIDPRAFAIECAVIRRTLLGKREGPINKRSIYQTVLTEIASHNASSPHQPIVPPGETTVSREIDKQIPAKVQAERKYGEKKAKRLFRQNANPRDQAVRPLERSEYDDIDSGVFLVDESNGLPWGRAYVTNGICQATAVLLGYDLSDRERSFESAIGAICHSLLPKPDFAPGEMGYGCQGQIILDNARYNFSRTMKQQSLALKLLLAATRPYGPTEKSSIEHYNHIVKSDFCPRLPGWRGEKGDREAIDEGICTAAMTLRDFDFAYKVWLRDVYANLIGEDGYTSKQRWQNAYRTHGPAVRYSREQLALFRLRPGTLKFRDSGGLLRLRLRYASEALAKLQARMGARAEVQIYTDRNDLTYLLVLNPYTTDLLRVPCVEDVNYVRGLREAQQKLIISIAKSRGIKNPTMKDLVDGRQRLAVLVKQAAVSTKLLARKWARKARGDAGGRNDTDKNEAPAESEARKSTPEVRILTELEYEIEELKELVLTEEDEW